MRVRSAALAVTILLVPLPAYAEIGIASVYRDAQPLACGGRLNSGALTAAHKTLVCGSKVRVTNKKNGRSVIVTIRDRGPFVPGRILDLTMAAADAIGMGFGLAPVSVARVN